MSIEKEKPKALEVIPENIPEELKKLKQWTLWKYRKLENGTCDKPNFHPSGNYAKVDDPSTWSTFDEVVAALPQFDGISFVITKESGIVGIDLDHVKGNPQEQEIWKEAEAFESYMEKSPSGEGIRVFARGIKEGPNCKNGNFEMYDDKKFLSVTGNVIGSQKTINKAAGALVRFYRKHFPEEQPAVSATWKTSPDMSDDEVLRHLMTAKNSEKFVKLYLKGDTAEYGCDDSAADNALCFLIGFYTQKPGQIISIMKKSRLYRKDKWERDDYLPRTVNKMLCKLTDTFQPQAEKQSTKKKSGKSKTSELFDDEGNLIIPEHIKDLISRAKEEDREGITPCLKWIQTHAVELASIHKIFWREEESGNKKNPEKNPPKLAFKIGDAFKLEREDTIDVYPILKENNQLYHNAAQKLRKIRTSFALYSEEVKKQALQELFEGDPHKYIVETWQQKHVGDIGTGKLLPLCAVSTFILGDNSGLHFKQSGDSGKGKTSGIDAFLKLLPPSMVIRGNISDKYVYYSPEEDIKDGSIIFIDDRELSESLKGVVKTAVSNFQKPEPHRTVIDGKGCVYTPAKRLAWMFASVDGFDDEQLLNRFLMADVDCSREQDDAVADGQRKAERALFTKTDFRAEVCKCIFDILRMRNYSVKIPYAEALKWYNPENRRNQPKFFDIIRAVCIFKVYQRNNINDYIIATQEDLERAEEIYEYTVKQTKSNLTEKEQKILNLLCTWNEDFEINSEAEDFKQNPSHKNAYKASIKDIAAKLDLPVESLRKIMEGRPQKGILGLLDRVKGLYKDIEDSGRHTVLYSYAKRLGTFDDLNVFVTYKDREIEKETNDFLKKLTTHPIPISVETSIERQAFLNISPLSPLLTTQCGEKFFKRVEDIFNISKDYTNISNNIYNISHHNLEKRELEEKVSLDCKKLESGCLPPNSLHSTLENTQKIYDESEKSGEILKKQPTNSENISPLEVESGGESGEILGKMLFVSSTNSENVSHTEEIEDDENPFVLEMRYSQKTDFVITLENQQSHEENLRQIALIPEPTDSDHFYHYVKGIKVQEIPTPENQQSHEENLHQLQLLPDPTELDYFNQYIEGRSIVLLPSKEENTKNFEEDFLYLLPNIDQEEKQRFLNLYNWVHQRCKDEEVKYNGNVYLELLFEENGDFDNDLIQFFAECMEKRGEFKISRYAEAEVQACSA